MGLHKVSLGHARACFVRKDNCLEIPRDEKYIVRQSGRARKANQEVKGATSLISAIVWRALYSRLVTSKEN